MRLFVSLVLVAVLLQLASGADDAMVPSFEEWIRSKRSGRDQDCCTIDALNNLQEGLQESLSLLTQTVFEIGFELQEFINLGLVTKYPAYSCHQIAAWKPGSHSGYYWLRGPKDYEDAYAAHMYCNMNTDVPIFGTTQGWMEVANLDLNDPYQVCPSGFNLITNPKRLCAKSADKGCSSIVFHTHHIQYKRVCGRAIAYQVGTNNAFHRFKCDHCTIDDPYIDGISFTHGKHPRKHIWSLAAQWVEKKENYPAHCPCAKHSHSKPPKFVGDDYFCETGKYWDKKIDLNNPLWDGEGCGRDEKECCEKPGLPWFCKDLPEPTTDDIEVRVCADESKGNEDLWFELIQLYAQ